MSHFQYAKSWQRVYCYTELAVSSLAEVVTTAIFISLSCGSLDGWLNMKTVYQEWSAGSVILLTREMTLPLNQIVTLQHNDFT